MSGYITNSVMYSQRHNSAKPGYYEVSSESEMLNLPAKGGDYAYRTDAKVLYFLLDVPASMLGNWKPLGAGVGGVTTVFGRPGPSIVAMAGDYNAGQIGGLANFILNSVQLTGFQQSPFEPIAETDEIVLAFSKAQAQMNAFYASFAAIGNRDQPNGYAGVGSNGKINASIIPDIAGITSFNGRTTPAATLQLSDITALIGAKNTAGGFVGLEATTSNVSIAGSVRIHDKDIYLRLGVPTLDIHHGLGWYGTGKLFANVAVDGPVLYGFAGGALGTNSDGIQKIALSWSSTGVVTAHNDLFYTADGNNKIGYRNFFESTAISGLVVMSNATGALGTVSGGEKLSVRWNSSQQVVITAPTTAIADASMNNNTISFYNNSGIPTLKFKNNSGVVTNHTWGGGGSPSYLQQNLLNLGSNLDSTQKKFFTDNFTSSIAFYNPTGAVNSRAFAMYHVSGGFGIVQLADTIDTFKPILLAYPSTSDINKTYIAMGGYKMSQPNTINYGTSTITVQDALITTQGTHYVFNNSSAASGSRIYDFHHANDGSFSVKRWDNASSAVTDTAISLTPLTANASRLDVSGAIATPGPITGKNLSLFGSGTDAYLAIKNTAAMADYGQWEVRIDNDGDFTIGAYKDDGTGRIDAIKIERTESSGLPSISAIGLLAPTYMNDETFYVGQSTDTKNHIKKLAAASSYDGISIPGNGAMLISAADMWILGNYDSANPKWQMRGDLNGNVYVKNTLSASGDVYARNMLSETLDPYFRLRTTRAGAIANHKTWDFTIETVSTIGSVLVCSAKNDDGTQVKAFDVNRFGPDGGNDFGFQIYTGKFQLVNTGDARKTTGTLWTETSDAAAKNISGVANIDEAISRYQQLEFIDYTFNADAKRKLKINDNRCRTGLEAGKVGKIKGYERCYVKKSQSDDYDGLDKSAILDDALAITQYLLKEHLKSKTKH